MQKDYSERHTIGAVLWALSLQYYIAQVIVAAVWAKDKSYSWANNTISDLGNTHCGLYGSKLVCSPRHLVMNISFLLLGITMVSGAILLQKQLAAGRLASFGFSGMVLAGFGTILVGLFPENSLTQLHVTGAALAFIFGNLAMILLGVSLKRLPIQLRLYTTLSGIIGLIALILFITKTYDGLGLGGMERFVSYPQSIWMTVFGVYLLLCSRTESRQ